MWVWRKRNQRHILIILLTSVLILDIYYAYQRTDTRVDYKLTVDWDHELLSGKLHNTSKTVTPKDNMFIPVNQEVDEQERANFNMVNEIEQEVTYKIPRIIHQFWDTEHVPSSLSHWIESWLKYHPEWEYFFWTDKDVEELLKKHYPQHLDMYNGYSSMLHKANAMRYFVLHRYGGVYVDLDMEALKPIDSWLRWTSDCFLSLENYEHAYFHYQAGHPVVMNTIMACRAQHPFYTQIITNLNKYKDMRNTLRANGPFFLDDSYRRYHKTKTGSDHPLMAVQPKFFLPTFDPVLLEKIQKACKFTHLMSNNERMLCRQLASDKWRNTPGIDAYANHHWIHVNHQREDWKEKNIVYIRHIAPNAKDISGTF